MGWVLVGFEDSGAFVARRVMRATGAPHSVRLDSARIFVREEKIGDVLGFWHTHPEGLTGESSQDESTMAAYCLSFGKPMLSIIETGAGIRAWIHRPRQKKIPASLVFRAGLLLVRQVTSED